MAKLHADKVAGCVSHTRFSPGDIERLETRAAALRETHDFDDANHAYIEAATRIAAEARGHKENILGALTREDAVKEKAKTAAPIAPPILKKHDNLPDLADAVAKEHGWPQAVAEAYTQHTVLGRSTAKIAETLGIGKSTAHEMVQKMRPLMDEAKLTRLEEGAGIEPVAPTAVAESTAAAEEPAPDQKAEGVSETEADHSDNAPQEEFTASGDVADEDNQASGQGPRDEGSHINISDAPHGEGETKAKNDEQAEKAYKRVNSAAKDTAQARWDSLNNGAPKKQQVAWSDLGPGQKAGFADEAKKGKAAEAYASIAAMHREGIKLTEGDSTEREATVPSPDAVKQAQKYPAVAEAKNSIGFGVNLMRVEPGRPMADRVASAINTLGSESPTFDRTLRGLKALYVFKAGFTTTDDGITAKTRGFYSPKSTELAMNGKPEADYNVEAVLSHELAHAADNAAAREVGVEQQFASMVPGSRTLTKVVINDKGTVGVSPGGDLSSELVAAYKSLGALQRKGALSPDEAVLLNRLIYVLKPITRWIGAVSRNDPMLREVAAGFKEEREALQGAERHAATELPATLVEMQRQVPDALQNWMPLGKGFAEAFLKAKSHTEVFGLIVNEEVKNDTGAVNPDTDAGWVLRSDEGVSKEVRQNAAPAGGGVRRGTPQADATRAGNQQPGRADSAKGLDPRLNIPPPITGGAGVAAWLKAQTTDALWRNHPGLLGWLSTEQLADRWKNLAQVKSFSDTMRKMDGRAMQVVAESDKHSTQWGALRKRHGPKVDENFGQLLLDATTATVWPDRALTDAGNKHLDAKDAEVQAQHATLVRQYNHLPAAYRTLFQDIAADKAAQHDQIVAGLRKGIVEAYHPEPGKAGLTAAQIDQAAALDKDARGAFERSNVKSALDDKALKALWSDIDAHAAAFPALPGPYFPKMRFGDHIVSYKSSDYQAAEAAVAHANEQVQQLLSEPNYQPITELEGDLRRMEGSLKRSTRPEHRDMLKSDIAAARAERETLLEPIAAARKLLANQQNKLMLMKAEPSHYGVEFYENRALAMANEQRLKAHFGDNGTTISREMKDQFLRGLDGVTPAFMRTLEDKMSAKLSGVDAAKVRDAVRELYIRMQPENSATKRQLKRANVSGVRADEAQRIYAHSSMRAAHSIARLEHGNALHQHLNDLRFNHTDEDAKIVGNELGKRIAQNLVTPEGTQALSLITNATYLSYLGLSPSFMVTQITQPWVISAPIMAGRHGMRVTGKLLAQGGVDAAKLLKGSFNQDRRWKYHLDPQLGVQQGIINADEAKMLQELMDHGRIDITITHDLGATGAGASDGPLATAAQIASYPAQQLEMANRVSTALAGYRAERARGAPHLDAMSYADGLVADTHLNYSASNRARFMHATSFGGWGRVMFQFRAYQQGMLYLIYKNMADGMRGDKDARRSLAYLAGMQLATAGLAGMPLPGVMAVAIGLLYKGFTDDDDEKDLKEMLFQGVKSAVGETGATAVMRGIPAALGVDVSGKVGMGNIAEAVPYTDERAKGKDIVKDYFSQLVGGPALGIVMNWFEAAKAAGQGDFLKATAQAAPAALAGPLKAVGYASHGMTDSRGNTVLGADEMSAADTVIKALGFQPTEVQRVQDQRRAFFDARGNRNDARNKLLADYAHARVNGGDVVGVREDVAAFNGRHPDDRINASQLEKAVAMQRVRARGLRGGIPVGKHDKALAAELGVE